MRSLAIFICVLLGFRLKVEASQGGGSRDDTALNGIELFCANKNELQQHDTRTAITSGVGPWGNWRDAEWCTGGVLTGFELRSERSQGGGGNDDTAANDLRMLCGGQWIAGGGMGWGEWSGRRQCPKGTAICAIRTQIEPHQGGGVRHGDDDTALNNVDMQCCPL